MILALRTLLPKFLCSLGRMVISFPDLPGIPVFAGDKPVPALIYSGSACCVIDRPLLFKLHALRKIKIKSPTFG